MFKQLMNTTKELAAFFYSGHGCPFNGLELSDKNKNKEHIAYS